MPHLQQDTGHHPRAARMHTLLTALLSPSRLEIIDDSAKHAGHAGARHAGAAPSAGGAGETHFTIRIVSDVFTSRSRLERSRMVHDALAAEFAAGLHAISLHLRSPAE